jgi:hypothetical protein
MDKCNDYWCENYGANNAKCAECKQQDKADDPADIRIMLQRRKIEQAGALAEYAPKRENHNKR